MATFFFATQIIPVKYLKHLCGKAFACQNQTEDSGTDEEEDSTSDKLKEKAEKEIKFCKEHFFPMLNFTSLSANKHFHFNIFIKNNYSSVVPTPPPNF